MGARWRRRDSPGAAAKSPGTARGGRLDLAARHLLLPAAALSIAAGLALLGYTGYQVWDPGAQQSQSQLIGRLRLQWAQHPARPIAPVTGQPFAVLRIPALGARWRLAVIEGTKLSQLTQPTQLAEGPGHVPGTQLPGQPGNFAVAAHDITAGNAFLHLSSLRQGDGISVTTVNGTYQYRVLAERVVRDTDVSVLDPVPGKPGQRPGRQFITLITCTPVTLAATPWRIVVTGVLTGMTPATALVLP